MTIQVALTFPDFAAAQAFFNGAAMQPKADTAAIVDNTKPAPGTITVLPEGAQIVADAKPAAKPGRKPKASEPAPAPAASVPPLDVKNGDPLPASMQAESTVDPLDVPAFLDRREPAAEAAPPKVWTEEEVRSVLKDVSAKHGLDAVRQLLVDNCGKSRISEVPATDYAKLAEAAQKKIAA